MNINTNVISFEKKHKNKKNQVIFHKSNCKNSKVIEEVEDIKEESLKDKNLKYILEHFPCQEKMFCVESCRGFW